MTGKRTPEEGPEETGPIAWAAELRRLRDETHERGLNSLAALDEAFDLEVAAAICEVRAVFPKQADLICEGFDRQTAYWSKVVDYLADYGSFECELGEIRLKENAAKAVAARLANDRSGKHAVMIDIRDEWKNRKDAGLKFTATAFAKEMAKVHKDAVTVEAIKNAQTRWNQEYHPSS